MAVPAKSFASLDTVVADGIREKILTGALPQGAHLVEAEFVKEYQVSHGTVRSALKTLAFEGLVEFRPRRGMYVSELTKRDAIEIYSLRDALESLAARRAAEMATPDERKTLQGLLNKLKTAAGKKDRKRCQELDLRIHRFLVDCARHRRLSAMYAQLESQIRFFLHLTDPLHDDPEEIYELHKELLEAVIAGDMRAAENLASRHNEPDGDMLADLLDH